MQYKTSTEKKRNLPYKYNFKRTSTHHDNKIPQPLKKKKNRNILTPEHISGDEPAEGLGPLLLLLLLVGGVYGHHEDRSESQCELHLVGYIGNLPLQLETGERASERAPETPIYSGLVGPEPRGRLL